MNEMTPDEKEVLKGMQTGSELDSHKPIQKYKLRNNYQFHYWLLGLFLCLLTMFTAPLMAAMRGNDTREMWVKAFCAGEVMFIGITSMIAALNDRKKPKGKFPAFDLGVLVVGIFFYTIIKAVSSGNGTYNMVLSGIISAVFFLTVLIRCIAIYISNGMEAEQDAQ